MVLLPFAWMRASAALLQPLRRLTATAWLREAQVDGLLQVLHPAWSLNRVLAQVEAREWVADDMLVLSLRCNGNAHGWQVGQYVPLSLLQDGVRLRRHYSLTAVRSDGRIELAIKRQPGGRLSSQLLYYLAIGQVVELGQAVGTLHWPASRDGVLLLAAGSGIAPLLGLLRQALSQGFAAPVTLLHYVHQHGQRAFRGELQSLMSQYPNLQVRWAISAEPAAPDQLSGRFEPAHLHALPGSSLLVCGPQGFVARVREQWAGELQAQALSLLRDAADGLVSSTSRRARRRSALPD